jgi:hypothetical protein
MTGTFDAAGAEGVYESQWGGGTAYATWTASRAACIGSPGVLVAALAVRPALDTVPAGSPPIAVVAVALGSDGRYVSGGTITWSAEPAGLVTLRAGPYLPEVAVEPLAPGTVRVTAVRGALTASATLEITPALTAGR